MPILVTSVTSGTYLGFLKSPSVASSVEFSETAASFSVILLLEIVQRSFNMEMPTLYTPNQVADYLHVSRGTIYSLISRREIDSIKVGRSRRFTAQQVREYISRRGQEVIVVQ